MTAYAEGIGVLRAANVGKKAYEIDAITRPRPAQRSQPLGLRWPSIGLGRGTVDDQGRYRRGRASARPDRSLVGTVSSRNEADFAGELLSAMGYEFGGHLEKSES